MSINKDHLNYEKFIKNEIKTLGIIQGLAPINKHFQDLGQKSQYFSKLLKGRIAKTSKIGLNFECDLKLLVEKRIRPVKIGIVLGVNFSESAYQLSIFEGIENPLKLIRKIHFDYDPSKSQKDMKPLYHLQYGGELSSSMKGLNVDDSAIYPKISSPRLDSKPFNFALFLDMVFCEFLSEATNSIINRPEWRGLIKNNEDLILKEYYSNINRFLNSNNHKSSFLYRDFYYGKNS